VRGISIHALQFRSTSWRIFTRTKHRSPGGLLIGELGKGDADQLRVAEQFLLLARDLILLGRKTHRCIHSLPAQKASTREELFRRVARRRDYLHSRALIGVNLEDMAREACVSTFHFHRAFTQLFGIPPHEYVTRIRMEAAAELLKNRHDLTVTEVAGQVAFTSATSFSKLFRRRFGLSPQDFRRRPSSVKVPSSVANPHA
jgi:AraC family transcriptional regulator